TVKAPALYSLRVLPGSVTGGANSTGVVQLTGAAPSGGVTIPLSSGDTNIATVPGSVTVAAGKYTGSFTVTTSPQAAETSVTITADPGGANKTASLAVKAPALYLVAFYPTSLKGGASTRLTVILNGAAPAGGTSVSLSATAVPGG